MYGNVFGESRVRVFAFFSISFIIIIYQPTKLGDNIINKHLYFIYSLITVRASWFISLNKKKRKKSKEQ